MAPGSCLHCTVLVILFSGRGIGGVKRAHSTQCFESGFGRHWDRCLTLPLKIRILILLKGSRGTGRFLRAQSTPHSCPKCFVCIMFFKSVSNSFFKNIWTLLSKFFEHSQYMHIYLCVSYIHAIVQCIMYIIMCVLLYMFLKSEKNK